MPAYNPNKPGFLTALHHVVNCPLHGNSEFLEAYHYAIRLCPKFRCFLDGLIPEILSIVVDGGRSISSRGDVLDAIHEAHSMYYVRQQLTAV